MGDHGPEGHRHLRRSGPNVNLQDPAGPLAHIFPQSSEHTLTIPHRVPSTHRVLSRVLCAGSYLSCLTLAVLCSWSLLILGWVKPSSCLPHPTISLFSIPDLTHLERSQTSLCLGNVGPVLEGRLGTGIWA